MDGLQEGENIYIDPRPATLETLLHELLHRNKPRWGEPRVSRVAHKLITAMTEEQKRRWWRAYGRLKRKRPPVEVLED